MEQIVEHITALASVITAITVIVTCIITSVKTVRRVDKKINDDVSWRQKMEKHDADNYLNILRLVIMSDSIPIEERISAGDKYIAAGGNGAVKHYYQDLIEKL